MKRTIALSLSLSVALTANLAFGEKNSPPAPDTTVDVPVYTPVLLPVTDTKPMQTKGGIRISVEPLTIVAKAVPKEKLTPFQPGFKEIFHIPCMGNGTQLHYYKKTYEPGVETKPENLVLNIHVDNQMPRVFRAGGLVVQFNVNGMVSHIAASAYSDLANAVIPPRNGSDFTIIGPLLSQIPPHATVAVDIFDVITKIDAAGNIQEKQDYEWVYSYELEKASSSVTLPGDAKICLKE